jgi:putative oxidoreductase
MAAFRTPFPAAAFWLGQAMLFAGCALVLADWHADVGAALLIAFTVAATAIFHRFWSMQDPMKRLFSRITFTSNVAILGGLLLLLANAR